MSAQRRHYPVVRAGKNEVIDKVSDWLARQRPGHEFAYFKLATELELVPGSVSSVLRRLAQADRPPIVAGYRVGVWRVTEEAAMPPQLTVVPEPKDNSLKVGDRLEVVMLTQDGHPVLRDANGLGYRASPL